MSEHLKWYWIAGGSSGIGFAVAKEMAAQNHSLILSSRSLQNLEAAKIELLNLGATQVLLCPLTLADPNTFECVRKTCESNTINLDGALLNGGGPHGGNFLKINPDDFDTAHKLLFLGPAMLLQALFPFLKKPGSSIVAITSTTVKESNLTLPLSGAYRSALVSLLKTVSLDWGRAYGIRVNNVAPGYISTQRLSELKNFVGSQTHLTIEEVEKNWAALAALNRIADPSEVAKPVSFLLSDAASFITGQTLVVDGGQLKQY